jgi:hypothetical protein
MAGSFPRTWQHESHAPIAGESHPCAVARQQSGEAAEWEPSRQADAGTAAQKTTTANISNAPFLPQFTLFGPRLKCKHPLWGRLVAVI